MPRVPEDVRNRILGHVQAGSTEAEVARTFNVHRHTVANILRKFNITQSVADLPRSGRPKVTTAAQDRRLVLVAVRERHSTARAIGAQAHVQCSDRTVRRRLEATGLTPRKPAKKPELLPRHRQNRLQWVRQHVRLNRGQWGQILFTDESRFHVQRHDGRQMVYRRAGERYAQCCVQQAAQYGHGSVMAWAGITATQRTDLVIVRGNLNAQNYINNILTPHAFPLIQQQNLTLQQDNAPAHRARVTQVALANNNIAFVNPWPAISPDLNPIEHA